MRMKVYATLLAALAVLVSSIELGARRASPSVLMIHGGDLKAPVFMVNSSMDEVTKFKAFWCATSNSGPG